MEFSTPRMRYSNICTNMKYAVSVNRCLCFDGFVVELDYNLANLANLAYPDYLLSSHLYQHSYYVIFQS